MNTFLSFTSGNTINLTDRVVWNNKYDWTPIKQSTEYSITGSLIIQEAEKTVGKIIKLDVSIQQNLLDLLIPKLIEEDNMILTLDSTPYIVRWDQSNPIETEPYLEVADPDITDWYKVKLSFIVVQS